MEEIVEESLMAVNGMLSQYFWQKLIVASCFINDLGYNLAVEGNFGRFFYLKRPGVVTFVLHFLHQ